MDDWTDPETVKMDRRPFTYNPTRKQQPTYPTAGERVSPAHDYVLDTGIGSGIVERCLQAHPKRGLVG